MDARALTFALVLAACAGPDARVHDPVAAPSPLPGATRVSFDIENRAGEGTVELRIELRDTAGTLIRVQRPLGLAGHQTVHFETDVETPPGTYSVVARAQYPD